MNNFYWPWT